MSEHPTRNSNPFEERHRSEFLKCIENAFSKHGVKQIGTTGLYWKKNLLVTQAISIKRQRIYCIMCLVQYNEYDMFFLQDEGIYQENKVTVTDYIPLSYFSKFDDADCFQKIVQFFCANKAIWELVNDRTSKQFVGIYSQISNKYMETFL